MNAANVGRVLTIAKAAADGRVAHPSNEVGWVALDPQYGPSSEDKVLEVVSHPVSA